MKYFALLIKLGAGAVVLAGIFLVSGIVNQFFNGEGNAQILQSFNGDQNPGSSNSNTTKNATNAQNAELNNKLKKAASSPDYALGMQAFTQAAQHLQEGDFLEGEKKLKALVGRYPFSSSAVEARRILGQFNIDRVFSLPATYGKKTYKVARGDSYNKIAYKNETSLANLMRLNDLFNLNRLRAGDELVLMPLYFNLVIDFQQQRLTLEYGKKFVKDYPYTVFKGKTKKAGKSIKTTVRKIEAQNNKKRKVSILKTTDYLNAHKIIVIGSKKSKQALFEIVSDQYPVDTFFHGIQMPATELEELITLLRKGNLVELRY